jgi:ADP-heptose:LPS heptosyltransferase
MKKALLINLSGIGDIISSLVLANPLSKEYEITYLIPKPFIGMFSDSSFKEIYELDNTEYDLLIDLTTNNSTRKLSEKANAKRKIGRCKNTLQKFRFRKIYSKMVPKFAKPVHIVRDYYPLNRLLNLKIAQEIFLDQKIEVKTEEIVSIHVGAGRVIRRIPEKLILNTIEYFQSQNVNVRIIGMEEDVIDSILSKAKNLLYDKGDLNDVKIWLRQSKLVIASDSGIFHLATALNIPAIGIYGPNTSARAGSLNKNLAFVELNYDCRPCNQNVTCPYNNKCMHDITWEQLKENIDKLI